MGLQYTEFGLRDKVVNVVTSEGGVGRGLEPLTSILNTVNSGQGGSTTTTYAPSFTFLKSSRSGVSLPSHDQLGQIDFRNGGIKISLWHATSLRLEMVVGHTLKETVRGLSAMAGRMKPLPKWTQEGAVVGLQGGQAKIMQDYNFLKQMGVPMKGIWMQDWVGTFSFPEGVRLLWNWALNKEAYTNWDQMVDDWEKEGVRPMIYMNPYLANLTGNPEITRDLFKEA